MFVGITLVFFNQKVGLDSPAVSRPEIAALMEAPKKGPYIP